MAGSTIIIPSSVRPVAHGHDEAGAPRVPADRRWCRTRHPGRGRHPRRALQVARLGQPHQRRAVHRRRVNRCSVPTRSRPAAVSGRPVRAEGLARRLQRAPEVPCGPGAGGNGERRMTSPPSPVTRSSRRSAHEAQARGTLRAARLGKIAVRTRCPTVPRSADDRPGPASPRGVRLGSTRRRVTCRSMTSAVPRLQEECQARRSWHRWQGGKTAGRGTKGLAPATPSPRFEAARTRSSSACRSSGIQQPFRVEYQAVNLHTLGNSSRRTVDARVNPSARRNGICTRSHSSRCVARGEIRPRSISTFMRSRAAAEQAVTSAGGTVTLIELRSAKRARPASCCPGNQFANR